MTPRPCRYVDARTAAQHLAHRIGDAASVQQWVGGSDEPPIQLTAESPHPQVGIHDQLRLVGASRFKQQHVHLWIGGEPASDYRPGSSGSAYNKVERPPKLRRTPRLVLTDPGCELRLIFVHVCSSLHHRLCYRTSWLCRAGSSSTAIRSSFLACSTPMTGRFPGFSSPTCARSEAWSQ